MSLKPKKIHPRLVKPFYLLVTRRCNLKCDYCYIYPPDDEMPKDATLSYNNGNDMDELSVKELEEIMADFVKAGYNHLHIYGGEPFLRNDLKIIVRKAIEMGIEVNIATNMLLINDSDLDWLKEYMVSLSVNMNYWDLLDKDEEMIRRKKILEELEGFEGDANTEMTGMKDLEQEKKSRENVVGAGDLGKTGNSPNETQAREDTFYKTPKIFKSKMEIIEKLVENEIPFTIITVLTRENYLTYPTFIEHMLSIGAKDFWANYFSRLGRGKNKGHYSLGSFEYHNFIKYLEQENQFRRSSISDANLSVEASFISENDIIPYTTYCDLLDKNKITIDANGEVYPCLLMINNEYWKLGNIRETPLKYILMRLNKSWFSQKLKHNKMCSTCKYFEQCRGGCPAYYNEENMDYRCHPRNIGGDLYLACPFKLFF
ncbi:MAG: radical SAM protein [Promethearchaeota archaeon]